MENKTFSWRRLSLMFKYNLVSYSKAYLIYYGTVLGLLLIVFYLALISNGVSNDFFRSWFFTMLVFSAMTIPSISFAELRSKITATTFLTLPASSFEKFITSFLITTIGAIIAYLAVFLIFNILAVLIAGLLHTQLDLFSFWSWKEFYDLTIIYIFIHSAFFLGATIFKRSKILQTWLWITIIIIGISIILGAVAGAVFHTMSFTSYNIFDVNIINGDKIIHTLKITNRIVASIVVLLLWTASYFKIKEKEVI